MQLGCGIRRRPQPRQKYELNETQRIDIRIAAGDRAFQDGHVVEELALTGHQQNRLGCALVLQFDSRENPLAHGAVADRDVGERIFSRIELEYQRTTESILLMTGQAELLDNMPVLKRSIARRNPYVDPLSFIQLVLLARLRSGNEPSTELQTAVLESINGIASGLKNTG